MPIPEAELQRHDQKLADHDERPRMEYGELSEREKAKMEILDRQFENPKFVEIPTPGNESEKIRIEYYVLDARNEDELAHAKDINDRTILHVPGFGVSPYSSKQLVQLMALKEHKRIIMVSQPGTGGSDMPPREWRKWKESERSFAPFGEVLNNAVDEIKKQEAAAGAPITTEQLSVTSSSLGSVIATEFARKHPEKVSDLVLLHPGAVFVENLTKLAGRYLPETIGSKKRALGRKPIEPQNIDELKQAYQDMFGESIENAYKRLGGEGEYDMQAVDDQASQFHGDVAKTIMTDSQKNLWRGKLKIEGALWRLWDALTISKANLLKMLPEIKANTLVVYGSKDKLFPDTQIDSVKAALTNAPHVETKVYPTVHDEPYMNARHYAGTMGTFLEKMRKKELEGKAA